MGSSMGVSQGVSNFLDRIWAGFESKMLLLKASLKIYLLLATTAAESVLEFLLSARLITGSGNKMFTSFQKVHRLVEERSK